MNTVQTANGPSLSNASTPNVNPSNSFGNPESTSTPGTSTNVQNTNQTNTNTSMVSQIPPQDTWTDVTTRVDGTIVCSRCGHARPTQYQNTQTGINSADNQASDIDTVGTGAI